MVYAYHSSPQLRVSTCILRVQTSSRAQFPCYKVVPGLVHETVACPCFSYKIACFIPKVPVGKILLVELNSIAIIVQWKQFRSHAQRWWSGYCISGQTSLERWVEAAFQATICKCGVPASWLFHKCGYNKLRNVLRLCRPLVFTLIDFLPFSCDASPTSIDRVCRTICMTTLLWFLFLNSNNIKHVSSCAISLSPVIYFARLSHVGHPHMVRFRHSEPWPIRRRVNSSSPRL